MTTEKDDSGKITDSEIYLEVIGFLEDHLEKTQKENASYFDQILILTGQRDHLLGMLEWIIEAHGNSETTEYTLAEFPWKLKDFIEESLKEDYAQIDFTKK